MKKNNVVRMKPIAAAIAACWAMGGTTVYAQDGNAPVEEVLVTGIRASLERAMDVKRDSSGVVDAITAEDIGKFPDTNLAESLQRISGVSIDRRNGEGYQVTVRGFGPQFNLVTLNGRTLPASQLTLSKSGGGNASANRSFDMSNIAAEGVSGVEIYKTSQASISSGGIGATVNLKTRKPMDQEGFTATVGAKALYDTTNRINKDWTPEVSSFVGWSNDMFGASAALSFQDRNSGENGVFTNGYSARSGGWTNTSMIPETPATGINVIDQPRPGQQTNFTEGVRYYHGDRQRTRENAQLTFQYRPTEQLTATLDYTYAEQDIFVNSSELSFWFGGGTHPTTDVDFDGRSDVATIERLWAESPTQTVRDMGITQNQGHVNNRLKSTGFNLEYLASDSLTFTLDAHQSKSSSLPGKGAVGNYFNIATGAQGVWGQGYDNSGDLPLLVGIYGDDNRPSGTGSSGNVSDVLDIGDLGSTVRQIWNARSWSETTQIKVDGKWEFSDAGSIDFGIEQSSFESTQKVSSLQEVLEGNWGVGTPGDVPPFMMEELDYADLFDGYSMSLSPQSRAFFDQAGNLDADNVRNGSKAQVFTRGWIARDTAELGQLLSYNAGLPWAPNPDDNTNRKIEEDITALYIQGSYDFEIANMPAKVHAGIRYESTDTKSTGQVAASTIVWQGDNDLITNAGNAADAPIQVGEGDYSNTLPSITFSIEPTEDVVVRAAYSKSIARPSYGNMLLGVNNVRPPNGGPTLLGAQPGTASSGTPALKPLESNNYDISVEWYYGDASYASIGYFYKDVPNFVGNGVQPGTVIADVLDQTNGPRAQQAYQDLLARGVAAANINSRMLFQMMAANSPADGPGCVNRFGDGENATNSAHCGADYDAYDYEQWEDNVDLYAIDGDPAYVATLNYPVDNESAVLDGWEFAVQHFFGDTGFGVQANYTIVNGDINYEITDTETQFALTGLSDSANLVGIYEYQDWSVRLAYNWRDDFLVTATEGGANQPRQTEAYSQIDLNVNYFATENLTLSFEGINLTGEDQRDYGRTESQLLRLDILGPRYALTGRYTF